jgi:hypothetical protein
MNPKIVNLFLFLILLYPQLYSQNKASFREQFFNDSSTLNVTLITNMSRLLSKNKRGIVLPANFVAQLPDGRAVNDQIQVEIRGHFRHNYCYIPPLKLLFRYKQSSTLYSLKSLKLVNQCKTSRDYEQGLLKEYIIYKIYNLLTDLSFRVRLLNLTFQDSSGRKKSISEHAFLIEDIKDLANRTNCIEWDKGMLGTETTDRRQMTIVAVFEYMIGNTDWSVPANHNIKLVITGNDPVSRPFVIPYDYDFSGFVNTEYAAPDEKLGIENVRQRLYRGYPRTMPELNDVLEIFRKQKAKIYATINGFDLLTGDTKADLTSYLNLFYETINDPQEIESVFIKEARKPE